MEVWILTPVLQTTALLFLVNGKEIWNFIKRKFIFKSQTYFYLYIFISSGFYLTLSLCSLPLLQKYMCFYSLLNSRQSGVVFSMFIAVHTFESEGFFSKSIWLVVALCTLFFLAWALIDCEEVVWNGLDTKLFYDICSNYGSSCFLSFLIRHRLTGKIENQFKIGTIKT